METVRGGEQRERAWSDRRRPGLAGPGSELSASSLLAELIRLIFLTLSPPAAKLARMLVVVVPRLEPSVRG